MVVLGSINLDLVAHVDHVPRPGETALAHDLSSIPGGKGANQALAARRMGASTVMLGMVGEDAYAVQALTFLRQDGVDLSRIGVRRDAPTGLALIVVERQGQNAITVIPGANAKLGREALAELDRVLTPEDVLMLQCEVPLSVVEGAIRVAKARRARVVLDPAPASERFPALFFSVDVLTPNQGEAEVLLGQRVDDVRAAKAAARHLHGRGVKVAIVKLGDQGVVWATDHGVFYLPGESVAAVDTVGAGDAFAGALAARLDAGDTLAEAIKMANHVAALSTTKPGAQPSYPWFEEAMKTFN